MAHSLRSKDHRPVPGREERAGGGIPTLSHRHRSTRGGFRRVLASSCWCTRAQAVCRTGKRDHPRTASDTRGAHTYPYPLSPRRTGSPESQGVYLGHARQAPLFALAPLGRGEPEAWRLSCCRARAITTPERSQVRSSTAQPLAINSPELADSPAPHVRVRCRASRRALLPCCDEQRRCHPE